MLWQCFWCLWKTLIMGFLEIYNSKHHSGKIGITSRGPKIWYFLKFYFFDIFVLLIKVFCENLSENKAKFLILEQTQYFRVLTRIYWFSVNMPSQKGHNYWTQPPKTIFQNGPHIFILKAKCEKIFVSPDWKILSQKSGDRGKFEVFLCVGSKKVFFEI